MLGTTMSRVSGFDLFADLQLVAPESHHFNVQIIVDKVQFLLEGHEVTLGFQPAAKNVRELQQHGARRVRVKANQRGNRVQSIKEKVGIDLADQRVHARLEQRFFLFHQLALNARGVPDAHRQAHANQRGQHDQDSDPEMRGIM